MLYSDYIGANLVWVDKGVLHLISHPCCIIKDKYCFLFSLKIVICCGCLKTWHTFYCLMCIRVWRHITLFTCVVHDDAIRFTYNSAGIGVQFYMGVHNGPSGLI